MLVWFPQRARLRFEDYAGYHKSRMNQWTHALGIPLIIFSALGLLRPLHFAGFDFAFLVLGFVGVYWVYVGGLLGLLLLWLCLGFYGLAPMVPTGVHWILFIAGWVLQGVGHYVYEKRSPAFTKNLEHLLIGPLWLLAKLFRLL